MTASAIPAPASEMSVAGRAPSAIVGVATTGPAGSPGRITPPDVAIKDLGKCLLPSPVAAHLGETAMLFVGAADKVLVDDRMSHVAISTEEPGALPAFELAGP